MSILEIVSSEQLRSLLSDVIGSARVEQNERTWLMDYLYKYSHLSMNQLPRGKCFDKVRDIQSRSQWKNYLDESQHFILREKVSQQFSPYLISQIGLMRAASLEGLSPYFLDTDLVLDMVKRLEGISDTLFSGISKHKIKFSRNGLLGSYKHHHIPLLPNSYVDFLSKSQSIEILSKNLNSETRRLDFDNLEKLVSQTKASRAGRMTGHWLISRKISGVNYYLGLYPHSKGKTDDKWILRSLIESEKTLKLRI
ncbi:TPA: hypothetical protein ACGF6J_003588 [Vibrio cholerae]